MYNWFGFGGKDLSGAALNKFSVSGRFSASPTSRMGTILLFICVGRVCLCSRFQPSFKQIGMWCVCPFAFLAAAIVSATVYELMLAASAAHKIPSMFHSFFSFFFLLLRVSPSRKSYLPVAAVTNSALLTCEPPVFQLEKYRDMSRRQS